MQGWHQSPESAQLSEINFRQVQFFFKCIFFINYVYQRFYMVNFQVNNYFTSVPCLEICITLIKFNNMSHV
jgi:hypothetical protein